MDTIQHLDTVTDYNNRFGLRTKHPLVAVVDFAQLKPSFHFRMVFGFYAIFLKDVKCGEMLYGRQKYDYQEGALVFIAPGQVLGIADNGQTFTPKGYALLFHPDLLRGTHLASMMRTYTFFSYEVNEALHINEDERQLILESLHKIDYEINQPTDKHTDKLITDSIQTILDYSTRFYNRQFETREVVNKDILVRFEHLLMDYFSSGEAEQKGLPTVSYCAEKLCLSPNYFSDLMRKQTGQTAQIYIQQEILNRAKNQLLASNDSINQISTSLGFEYPQHFTRLFKSKVGISPSEYRNKQ